MSPGRTTTRDAPDEPPRIRDQTEAPRDGVSSLVDALDIQDDTLMLGMVFEEHVKLAVDDDHATFSHSSARG